MRDNLLETPAGKATTAGTIFVSSGVNAIAERFILDSIIDTTETTTSTSYTSLATDGPTVTVTTGPKALVLMNCQVTNSAAFSSIATFEVSGATTVAASDSRSIVYQPASAALDLRAGVATLMATTAGSNTFRMLYRVTGGTGTFQRRRLQVMAL